MINYTSRPFLLLIIFVFLNSNFNLEDVSKFFLLVVGTFRG